MWRTLILLPISFALAGCSGKSGNPDDAPVTVPSPTPTPTPTPTPAPTSSTTQIGVAGGNAELAGRLQLVVPPETFSTSTSVYIAIEEPNAAGPIEQNLFGVENILDGYVITLGNIQPTLPISVKIHPNEILSSPDFYIVLGSSGTESNLERPAPHSDKIAFTFDSGSGSLTFDADPTFFAIQNDDGNFEGRFIVASAQQN